MSSPTSQRREFRLPLSPCSSTCTTTEPLCACALPRSRLPHQPDQARKRAIVDYVLQTRRQILKLLVLVRWSSEADNVTKCMVSAHGGRASRISPFWRAAELIIHSVISPARPVSHHHLPFFAPASSTISAYHCIAVLLAEHRRLLGSAELRVRSLRFESDRGQGDASGS